MKWNGMELGWKRLGWNGKLGVDGERERVARVGGLRLSETLGSGSDRAGRLLAFLRSLKRRLAGRTNEDAAAFGKEGSAGPLLMSGLTG
jgi:hypothetical protein